MDCSQRILFLRELTELNRKDFCEHFQIPYRTVTEWERGTRCAPEYVLRLLEYYIHDNLSAVKEERENEQTR